MSTDWVENFVSLSVVGIASLALLLVHFGQLNDQ